MSRLTIFALAVLGLGCRSGSGEQCVCASDCKSGLVCAIEGAVLEAGECTPDGVAKAGTCVPEDDIPSGDDGGPMTTGPYMDLGSKKDFSPDPTGASDTGTSSSTGSSTTSSGTSSSTGSGTGSTGTSSSTGSGTSSTGSSDTSTSGAT